MHTEIADLRAIQAGIVAILNLQGHHMTRRSEDGEFAFRENLIDPYF